MPVGAHEEPRVVPDPPPGGGEAANQVAGASHNHSLDRVVGLVAAAQATDLITRNFAKTILKFFCRESRKRSISYRARLS